MENQKPSKVISFTKLREFIRNSKLTPLEKCVFIDLLLYAGIGGEAFPSEKKIGQDLGYSDRHIRTQLNNLKANGWIGGWRKRGYSKSNQYTINEELYFRNDNYNRNFSSPHLGNKVPVQTGSPVPPKVNQESNQLSSSYIQQLFEDTSNTELNRTEISNLHKLCQVYTENWVIDAIKEATSRNYTFLSVKLISLILEDWKTDGKPQPKPVFIACGKANCQDGYIFSEGSNTVILCECRQNI